MSDASQPGVVTPRSIADHLVGLVADQAAADEDQVAADGDQMASDDDQSASERDDADASRDQRSADLDQASADDGRGSGPGQTTEAYEASRAARIASRIDRLATHGSRVRTARGREAGSADRAATADQRDTTAHRREALAVAVEDAIVASDDPVWAKLERLREQALQDRASAAANRARAAADRGTARVVRERLEAELHGAYLDELTGAFRRGLGWQALALEIDRARRAEVPFVLVFIDIDDMKDINERQGQTAGDRVLRALVAIMRANLRSFDPIVRSGGDEFACGIAGAATGEVAARFDRIDRELRDETGAGVSVGIALLAPGETMTEITSRADALLLAAKHARHGPR